MASTSGNSSVSTKSQSSGGGSEEDLQLLMDQRKRKRKQSNRESARRSRMRKQKHLDDLIVEMERLGKENSEMVTRVNMVTQHYLEVEAENGILRAQMGELSQRLQSLNDIINLINTTTGVYQTDCYLTATTTIADHFMNNNPIHSMHYLNQPIVASANIFQW